MRAPDASETGTAEPSPTDAGAPQDSSSGTASDTLRGKPMPAPDAGSPTPSRVEAEPTPSGSAPLAEEDEEVKARPRRVCGAASPYGDELTCDLPAGHRNAHRSSDKATWT